MVETRRFFPALKDMAPAQAMTDAYYQAAWEMRGEVLDGLIAAGEVSLPRLLSRMQAHEEQHVLDVDMENGRLTGWLDWKVAAEDWAWRGLRKLESNGTGVLRGHDYEKPPYVQFNLPGMLADFADDVDTIVELGSGYGLQLFRLFYAGAPADARYVGAEISPSGRAVADRLAALQPGLRFESRAFDLMHPDWSFLEGSRKALIFSAWALMYPPRLPADFLHGLARWPGAATLVFCEPVGFQWGLSHRLSAQQKDASEQGRLNTNLLPLLGEAAKQGVVEPLLLSKDLFARSGDDAFDLISILVYAKSES